MSKELILSMLVLVFILVNCASAEESSMDTQLKQGSISIDSAIGNSYIQQNYNKKRTPYYSITYNILAEVALLDGIFIGGLVEVTQPGDGALVSIGPILTWYFYQGEDTAAFGNISIPYSTYLSAARETELSYGTGATIGFRRYISPNFSWGAFFDITFHAWEQWGFRDHQKATIGLRTYFNL